MKSVTNREVNISGYCFYIINVNEKKKLKKKNEKEKFFNLAYNMNLTQIVVAENFLPFLNNSFRFC